MKETELTIHYTESNKFNIVPKYQGTQIDGFDVVEKSTGEISVHTEMLWEAEVVVLRSTAMPRTGTVIGSAAEVKHY